MNCEQTRARLTSHLDGETDISIAPAMEAHLKACAPCRSVRDETLTVLAAADTWQPDVSADAMALPRELSMQIMQAALDEIGRLAREVASLRAEVAELKRSARGRSSETGLRGSVVSFPYPASRDVQRPIV